MEINDNIDTKENDIALLNKGKVLKELLTYHTRRQLLREQKGHDEAYIIWTAKMRFRKTERCKLYRDTRSTTL